MEAHVVKRLEEFIEQGEMWDERAMEDLVAVLEQSSKTTGDPLPARLGKVFAALLLRQGMAPMDSHLAIDIEAHIYQRLYKILETAYDELPDCELRTRIEVLHRRLSRMIVAEDPQTGTA